METANNSRSSRNQNVISSTVEPIYEEPVDDLARPHLNLPEAPEAPDAKWRKMATFLFIICVIFLAAVVALISIFSKLMP